MTAGSRQPPGLTHATQAEAPSPQELAAEALRRGQEAAALGQTATARQWFERACRLLPNDDTATLCLAGTCLGQDDARAAELFALVSARHDVREAWIGLALARLRLNEIAAAEQALAAALGRFGIDRPAEITAIADEIARKNGRAGWCALGPDGELLLGPASKAALTLDGQTISLRGRRLPPGWQQAKSLEVRRNGQELLGSPIDIAAIQRVEGCVWTNEDGIEGWAWHPHNPAAHPTLTLQPTEGPSFVITAEDLDAPISGAAVLAQPRRFQVPASALAGPVSVTDPNGRHLSGSPLDPHSEQRDAVAAALAVAARFPAGAAAGTKRPPRRKPADVVIPVHGGGAVTLACIASVLGTLPRTSRLVVVDDASPDPDLAQALDRLAAQRRIRLIRHADNRGFPASANAGLRACAGRDVVLLNSDTLVPPSPPEQGQSWLERLQDAAYAAPGIGTVTPLSNNASILSYPRPDGANDMPSLAETLHLDRLAADANGGEIIDIPTAVGFCMYIRRDCLDAAGALREDVFAQGYGEENDFCMRARHLGWRHVAATGVFVAHLAGQSFGAARAHLLSRNAAVLDRLHPGYAALVARHAEADPLAGARRRIDLARWQRDGKTGRKARRSTLLITHFHGGGTERQLRVHTEAVRAAGQRPVVLRPARLADGFVAAMVGDGEATDYPNLRFALPEELPDLVRLLAAERPTEAQLHHMLGHDYSVLRVIDRLAIPYDVHVHDYASFCPRVGLLGPDRRYCGEPEPRHCEACIADIGRKDGLDIPVAELRCVSAGILAAARRVIVPSQDTASRIRRHFPATAPIIAEHGDDSVIPRPPPPRPVVQADTGQPIGRVAVIGAIGLEKGYEILLACARDAAWQDLPLEFTLIGHSIDDARLLATGRVFITGEYQSDEAVNLIRAQHASLALIPSIWPETWCFTLTEAWQAGLTTACFDIGAPAQRIRRSGHGIILPLGLSAAAINRALLARIGLAPKERA